MLSWIPCNMCMNITSWGCHPARRWSAPPASPCRQPPPVPRTLHQDSPSHWQGSQGSSQPLHWHLWRVKAVFTKYNFQEERSKSRTWGWRRSREFWSGECLEEKNKLRDSLVLVFNRNMESLETSLGQERSVWGSHWKGLEEGVLNRSRESLSLQPGSWRWRLQLPGTTSIRTWWTGTVHSKS